MAIFVERYVVGGKHGGRAMFTDLKFPNTSTVKLKAQNRTRLIRADPDARELGDCWRWRQFDGTRVEA